MKPALNLPLLSRVLSQPWAIRKETLVSFTQALLTGGENAGGMIPRYHADARGPREQADTSFNVAQWDGEEGTVVKKPLKTKEGYTVFNIEGWYADYRGTLPDVPENVSVHLLWGAMGRGWTMLDRYWIDPVDVDEVITNVEKQPEGSTVVLWFRSPGGIVTGIPEAAAELRRLGKTRRLLAFTDDMCCSAAMWLASQCEQIVATPTADVGSIGVYLAFYDFVGYLEKMGVKLELFREGELKGIGVMGNPLDDQAREHLQAGVTEAYRLFTKDVTNMRAIEDEHMQGQSLNGKAAKAANLVDRFVPSAGAFFSSLTRFEV